MRTLLTFSFLLSSLAAFASEKSSAPSAVQVEAGKTIYTKGLGRGEVAIQAGFFVAPIIYPLDILPERAHLLLYLWPPTPVIEFTRAVLVDGALPSARAHLLLAASATVSLASGALLHRWLAPGSMERL